MVKVSKTSRQLSRRRGESQVKSPCDCLGQLPCWQKSRSVLAMFRRTLARRVPSRARSCSRRRCFVRTGLRGNTTIKRFSQQRVSRHHTSVGHLPNRSSSRKIMYCRVHSCLGLLLLVPRLVPCKRGSTIPMSNSRG